MRLALSTGARDCQEPGKSWCAGTYMGGCRIDNEKAPALAGAGTLHNVVFFIKLIPKCSTFGY